jgi:hypothetical protein
MEFNNLNPTRNFGLSPHTYPKQDFSVFIQPRICLISKSITDGCGALHDDVILGP